MPAIVTTRRTPHRPVRYRDDMHRARALVVDGNPTTRSLLAAQLRELGVAHVAQCARITEARARLESARFDIVLCEYEFPDGGGSGQLLLDDLRRHQLLPLATVFVMITGEATYARVAEAAESALDSYLLKPHTTASLAQRLAHARRRKTILRKVLQAVDEGRFAEAAEMCRQRFRSRGEYWLYAARLGSELLLDLHRHDEARELFDAVLAAKALPWARLGVARAQIEGGELPRATRTLESLIAAQPTYVDAYDVMGRALLEQGDFDGAMEAYLRAVALTPESITRLQKAGMLAYYRGRLDEAAELLERAMALGTGSKMFDWQGAALLAFARFRQGDARGVQRCSEALDAALSHAASSRRLQRLASVADALSLMQPQGTAQALARVHALAGELDAQDFDVEATSNLVTLLALLASTGRPIEGAEGWIDRMSMRHTGSRMLTELLVRAAQLHPPYADRIQAGHAQVGRLAESALAHALGGQPAQAVAQLLADAELTLSFKLLETARMTLQRYRARIAEAAAFDTAIEALRGRMAPQRSPLVEGNGRKPGALVLRRSRAAAGANPLQTEGDLRTAAPAAGLAPAAGND